MKNFKKYFAQNEPVLGYKIGSEERLKVEEQYKKMFNSKVDVPLYINGKHVFTNEKKKYFTST